ncbi:hypothetical protein FraQA3DRAFT_4848 [Frankia sp. QA3]|nr:hypothetical protein FraQA3DRAFT_4848 [Frankia sp. QA3]
MGTVGRAARRRGSDPGGTAELPVRCPQVRPGRGARGSPAGIVQPPRRVGARSTLTTQGALARVSRGAASLGRRSGPRLTSGPRGGQRSGCPSSPVGIVVPRRGGRRRGGRGRMLTIPGGGSVPGPRTSRSGARHTVHGHRALSTAVPAGESAVAWCPRPWAPCFHSRLWRVVTRACRPDAGDRAVRKGTVTAGRTSRALWISPGAFPTSLDEEHRAAHHDQPWASWGAVGPRPQEHASTWRRALDGRAPRSLSSSTGALPRAPYEDRPLTLMGCVPAWRSRVRHPSGACPQQAATDPAVVPTGHRRFLARSPGLMTEVSRLGDPQVSHGHRGQSGAAAGVRPRRHRRVAGPMSTGEAGARHPQAPCGHRRSSRRWTAPRRARPDAHHPQRASASGPMHPTGGQRRGHRRAWIPPGERAPIHP